MSDKVIGEITEEEDVQIDFGQYAIIDSHTYHFEKLPDVYWKIKPVTSADELARAKFLMYNRAFETIEGTRYEMPPTAVEIRNREVALLFGGTNLKTRAGKAVLADDASMAEVEKVLGVMPPDMVNEVWVEIARLYPKWGPRDPKEWGAKTETKS